MQSIPDIQIISAPSVLGLKLTGVERLGKSLLGSGLAENLRTTHPVIHVPDLNHQYDKKRDPRTGCLNTISLADFSIALSKAVSKTINKNRFAFILGGDCSILIGAMVALKAKGNFGIVFLDAHADFYEPEKSTTGQAADMDLAIITGRGPKEWTNINNLQPYIKDENVIHIGQRDWKETKKYGSRDIRKTAVKCFSLNDIKKAGIQLAMTNILQHVNDSDAEGFWIHFDTDVLSDKINPAVDYRLPGGLSFKHVENLIHNLLSEGRIIGMSVTIFNPLLDKDNSISKNIADSIGRIFNFKHDN